MAETVSASTHHHRIESGRLRKDLFYKLGVHVQPEANAHAPVRDNARSLLGKVHLKAEPLKGKADDEEDPDDSHSSFWQYVGMMRRSPEPVLSSSCSTDGSGSDPNSPLTSKSDDRKISFDETVKVCPIPKKEEYSKRIRNSLWIPQDEMAENAQRNAIEFAAEGWDWKTSLEEDEMYRCVATHEFIHPVHVEQQGPTQKADDQT